MKADKDFEVFYNTSLLPILQLLEVDRKKLVRKMRLFLFVFLLFCVPLILGIIYTVNNQPNDPDAQGQQEYPIVNGQYNQLVMPGLLFGISGCILTGLIYGLTYHFYFGKKIGALKTTFKTKVIGQIVKFIDGSLQYTPDRGISRLEYQQSQLFLARVDRYVSEDFVSGRLGSTDVRFSEVHAQEKEEHSDGDGGKSTSWKTIFKGILFVADFNKNFNGRTIVLPDMAENLLGGFGTVFQRMDKSRGQLIKMDDVEFEKAFAVYGTNDVEAHYLLSPALMQRVMELRKKAGKIYFSFINSNIFIAIPVRAGLNLFEPKIYSSLIDYKGISEYSNYLLLVAGIVEDLNLNTRIWTKE
jgi:Protein of unknown function (DUF3137)